jgi:hypothetical protein
MSQITDVPFELSIRDVVEIEQALRERIEKLDGIHAAQAQALLSKLVAARQMAQALEADRCRDDDLV